MTRKGYVVLKPNGDIEVKPYENENETSFFNFVKENDIHCDMAEPIQIFGGGNGLPSIYFLGNENAYAELGEDPENANIIGTWLYNETYKLPSTSYVLGNLVLCTEREDENGYLIYAPFTFELANKLGEFAKEWKTRAEEKYPRPLSIPAPFVSIQTFDSVDEMIKAMGKG